MTQVPQIQFTPAGVSIPAEQDILSGVLADYDGAFGGGLNQDLSTPQGQLAQSQTAIIGDKDAQILEICNQVDPARNDGRWQDAIGRIYFMTRIAGTGTVVQATCSGAVGTVLPAGSMAQDAAGYLYASTGAAIIGADGTAQVQFQNQTDGPIACPAGSLARIYVAVTGWERVTNAAAGIAGSNVESAAEFEFRRKNSVAVNAIGSLPSIYANVFAAPDVLDVYCAENVTSAPLTLGATGYTLKPHSIYVAVVGGDPQAIAQAIWRKKNVGSDYNGNTTVQVADTSGYEQPSPTYQVTYNIPGSVAVKFAVQLANDPQLPQDITERVQQAIVGAFAGANGGARARIGATIYASRFYTPIAAIDPSVEILSVLIGVAAPTLNALPIGIDQAPTVSAADITVTVA